MVWPTLASRTALSLCQNADAHGAVECLHAGDGPQRVLRWVGGLQFGASGDVGRRGTFGSGGPNPLVQPSAAGAAGTAQGLGRRIRRPHGRRRTLGPSTAWRSRPTDLAQAQE